MRGRLRWIAILAGLILVAIWWHARTPESIILSFRLGQTFDQVVMDSTYPALKHANRPADDPGGDKFGAIWFDLTSEGKKRLHARISNRPTRRRQRSASLRCTG